MILVPGTSISGESGDFQVFARSGWRIPTETYPKLSPALMEIRTREIMNWRGGLTLRSLSNHTYNCVGMIFAARRAWVEIDYIERIFVEDGYRRIQPNDVMIGDVVLYRNVAGQPTHVAQIVVNENVGRSQNVKVLSKWGQLGEFIHFVENVTDNLGKPAEFYTERSL